MSGRNAAGLGLEHLEPRFTLAGNIVASLVGDEFSLVGDSFDNDAIVTVRDGLLHVASIKNTTINGLTSLTMNVDPARLNLAIDGDAGNDQLWVNVDTTDMVTNLTIRGGDGKDNLAVVPTGTGPRRLLGNVAIDGGKGDDFVDTSIEIDGALSILGGAGADQVNLRATQISGNLQIDAGDGNDGVSIAIGARVGGTLSLYGGKGRDTISLPANLATDAVLAAFENIHLL